MEAAACGEEKAGSAATHGLCYDEWMQCEKCERWRRCPSGTAEAFAATSFSCEKSFWESADRRSCETNEEDWRGQVVTLHDTGGQERRWNRMKRPKVEARPEKEEGVSSQQLSPSFRLPSSPAAFSAARWLSTAGACSEKSLRTAPDSVAAAAQRRPPVSSQVSFTPASVPSQRHADRDREAEGDRARERERVEENSAPSSSLRRAAEVAGSPFACGSEREGGSVTASLGSPRPHVVGDFERPREPHVPCAAQEKRVALASFSPRQPELCRESRGPAGCRDVPTAFLQTLDDALHSGDTERLGCSPFSESFVPSGVSTSRFSPQVSFAREESAGSLLSSPRLDRCGDTKETRRLQSREEEAADRARRSCLEFLRSRMQSLKDSTSSSPSSFSSSSFSSLARVPVDALAAVVAREISDAERVSFNSQRFSNGEGEEVGEDRAFSREREAGKVCGASSRSSALSSQRRMGGNPPLGGEPGEEGLWRRCVHRERMQTEDSDGTFSRLPGLHLPRERLCGERLSPLGGDTSGSRRALSTGGNVPGVKTEERDADREGGEVVEKEETPRE
ncbi:UNVERIFIED_CONTAM: CW-type zinc finger protein [Hammondia hammondi]|eukprot:XP_008884288.1 CW-type zinc finger protein [Hammondia hammondi]